MQSSLSTKPHYLCVVIQLIAVCVEILVLSEMEMPDLQPLKP